MNQTKPGLTRRNFMQGLAVTASAASLAGQSRTNSDKKPTDFQIACMTLPYSHYSFERALKGIAEAGYKYVAWGTRHNPGAGDRVPLLAVEDPPSKAARLAKLSRDHGLTPVMMFSGVGVAREGSVEAHRKRVDQASAAGIPQILTFGSTKPGDRQLWVRNLKAMAPAAKKAGVMLVVKQHGGETATGEMTADIINQVNEESVRINYDAGNVLDYMNVDPIPDIQTCTDLIRSFSIKDHRNFPKDQDCGPGLGEIDHYHLLAPVAFKGVAMPLACENIFAPLLPRPENAEGIDSLARRAREFLEIVVGGLQSPSTG